MTPTVPHGANMQRQAVPLIDPKDLRWYWYGIPSSS